MSTVISTTGFGHTQGMPADNERELTNQLNNSHGSFELVLSPLILALIGMWIDSQIGSGPWVTVVFAVVGVLGATASLYLRYQAKMEIHNEARASKSVMGGRI